MQRRCSEELVGDRGRRAGFTFLVLVRVELRPSRVVAPVLRVQSPLRADVFLLLVLLLSYRQPRDASLYPTARPRRLPHFPPRGDSLSFRKDATYRFISRGCTFNSRR